MKHLPSVSLLCAIVAALQTLGCPSEGVGDPCVPEDEHSPSFSGFSRGEVQLERASLQCETRLCLINHFQGRVSCPYGQTEAEAFANPKCFVPSDPRQTISVKVLPQLTERRSEDTVYCSCRCDGPDPDARYCECPSGFECLPIDSPVSSAGVQGSYCVRAGTKYEPRSTALSECDRSAQNCGPE